MLMTVTMGSVSEYIYGKTPNTIFQTVIFPVEYIQVCK